MKFLGKRKESNFHFVFTLWENILKTAICFGSDDIFYCSLFFDEINLFFNYYLFDSLQCNVDFFLSNLTYWLKHSLLSIKLSLKNYQKICYIH